MTDMERRQCTIMATEALSEVKTFFNAVVYSHRRPYFTSCAEKNSAQLLGEVAQLKTDLNNPESLQMHALKCKLYVNDSKRLIREVGFILAKSILPE